MARRSAADASERRTVKVTVQLTPSERASLDNRAVRTGETLSELCRRLMLTEVGREPAPPRDAQAIRALTVALVRIGTNLNQLAHIANETRRLPVERSLRDVVERIEAALLKVTAL